MSAQSSAHEFHNLQRAWLRCTMVSVGFWIILAALLLLTHGLFAEQSTAAELSPANVQQLVRVGMELVSERRLDDAIQVFERGLRLNDSNTLLLNAVGAVFNLKGNVREAERYFLKALSADPTFSPARKNLAMTYFESGKSTLAKSQIEQLGRDPRDSRLPSCS